MRSAREAATYMGVCTKAFYMTVATEGLRHVRLRGGPKGQIRTTRAWIDEWIEAKAVAKQVLTQCLTPPSGSTVRGRAQGRGSMAFAALLPQDPRLRETQRP